MPPVGASVQKKNKALMLQMLEAFNKRDATVVPKLLDPKARSKSTFPGNPEMTKMPVQKRLVEEIMRTAGGGGTGPIAFPDGQYAVKELLADGDKVILIWEMTGTHQGEILGRPATGKKVTVSGYEVVQFAKGKMVSHYDNHGTQTVLEVLAKVGQLDARMMKQLGFAQG
ncbi:MAG: ester cyclase [Gaiellaceae bacterium]